MQRTRGDLLIGPHTDVVHADDVGHFLQSFDVFVEVRKDGPDPDGTAGFCNRSRMIRADAAGGQSAGCHRLRAGKCCMRQQQRSGGDFCRSLGRSFGGVRHIDDHSQPMAVTDHLGAKFGQPFVRHHAHLEVTDIVRGEVNKLSGADAALVGFFQPLKLSFHEVQALDASDHRRMTCSVGRFKISCR
ncbi:hypothetical protein D3C86_1493260 [compost metagenome]